MFTAVVFVHFDPMNYVLPHRGFTCRSNLGLDSLINAKKFVDNTQNNLNHRFLKRHYSLFRNVWFLEFLQTLSMLSYVVLFWGHCNCCFRCQKCHNFLNR